MRLFNPIFIWSKLENPVIKILNYNPGFIILVGEKLGHSISLKYAMLTKEG